MARCGLLTLDTVGGKETDVTSLQGIFMRELWGASLRLGFSCQRGVVHLLRCWGEGKRERERAVLASDTEGQTQR